MTTILFDGTTLAADSRTTIAARTGSKCPHCRGNTSRVVVEDDNDKINLWQPNKKFKGSQILATASAGAVKVSATMEMLIKQGHDVKEACSIMQIFSRNHAMRPTDAGSLLVWTEESAWILSLEGTIYTEKQITELPFSMGSGGKASLLALKHLTTDIRVAVAYASDVDESSNDVIQYVTAEMAKNRVLGSGVITEKRGKRVFKDLEPRGCSKHK